MKIQKIKRQLQLEEWASQINAQRQSGMSVKQWCEAAGLGHKNFYYRIRKVQEEMLEALESKSSKSQKSELSLLNNKELPILHEAPVFAPVSMPQVKGAAVTVWIGSYAVDVQNGADGTTVEQILRVVSRL